MRRLLRRDEFNAFVSQRPQVNALEQRLASAEQDRRDRDVQFIDEAFTKIQPNCVWPAADPHVHSGSGLARTVERLAQAAIYEVNKLFDDDADHRLRDREIVTNDGRRHIQTR